MRIPTDRHTLGGLGAILIWSTSIALARSVTEQVGPLTAASSVHLIGGTFFVLQQFFFQKGLIHQVLRLPVRYLLGCGTLFVVYMLALFLAVGLAADRSQVLEIGLLNYLWPALTLIFSLFLLNKKVSLLLAPGTVLAFMGLFLVLTPGQSLSTAFILANVTNNPVAYALGLVAALSWALYSNLTRRWAGPKSSGGVAVFLPATGIILLMLRLLSVEESSWNMRVGLEVVFMGAATAIAYALWDLAMRKGDLVFVAACSYLTPVLSTLLSCIYLRVVAGFSLWLGCFLIAGGSLLSWAAVSDRRSSVGSNEYLRGRNHLARAKGKKVSREYPDQALRNHYD